MTSRCACVVAVCAACAVATLPAIGKDDGHSRRRLPPVDRSEMIRAHREVPDDPPAPLEVLRQRRLEPASTWTRGPFTSVQVNVDAFGNNITGDAANEPSIAIDPTNPDRIVIGWRQFDSITSDYREAGWAYSHDGGQSWTFPGSLDGGSWRSDPVLASDPDGNFYYNSLTHDPVDDSLVCHVFKSTDGGVSWLPWVYAYGGDKAWMTIDQTSGPGRGFIYAYWSGDNDDNFTRSTSGGAAFETILTMPEPTVYWGTLDVGPDGELYVAGPTWAGDGHAIAKSTNAQNSAELPAFEGDDGFVLEMDLGGYASQDAGPNPGGLLGQVWVATDHSAGPTRGNVYVLGSVVPDTGDPMDVMFIRSTDGGLTWSSPARINDDPSDNGAWQWFGTMSVAPNGRIDVIWNDTRAWGQDNLSELYYSYSTDAGVTWSPNVPASFVFDSWLGWPMQHKLGDYYHMVSDNNGANLAYAATFNDEQDVYFLRIERDCNGNGIDDDCDVDCGAPGGWCFDVAGCGTKADCNDNNIPDECEAHEDCQPNGVQDICDIAGPASDDCNFNDVPDECELAGNDCNSNGVPDECESADADCNGNGVSDICDIAGETSGDCQPDGIPDDCQLDGQVIQPCIEPCSAAADGGETWCDDFEGHPLGMISGLNWGSWVGAPWGGGPDRLGSVTDERNHTPGGSRSLKLEVDDNTLRMFHGYDLTASPRWILRMWVYIPSTHGYTNVVLFPDYDGSDSDTVAAWLMVGTYYDEVECYITGNTTPLVTDQWVEIRFEIDLEGGDLAVFYDGELLTSYGWTRFSPGSTNIAAINISRSAGTHTTYVDDMALFAPHTTDINDNAVPDECDLRDGTVCDVNENGILDTDDCGIALACEEACEGDSAEILPLATNVVVFPSAGGGTDLAQSPYVMLTSNSEESSWATVNHTCVDAYGEAGGLAVRGSGLTVSTPLGNGDYLMTVTLPTSHSAIRALAWLNSDNWVEATMGNTTREPMLHVLTDLPTLEYLHGLGLGAYGYYWPTAGHGGFVFANLDHASAFATGYDSSIPAVSQWGLLAFSLLVLAAGTVVLKRRRAVGI